MAPTRGGEYSPTIYNPILYGIIGRVCTRGRVVTGGNRLVFDTGWSKLRDRSVAAGASLRLSDRFRAEHVKGTSNRISI